MTFHRCTMILSLLTSLLWSASAWPQSAPVASGAKPAQPLDAVALLAVGVSDNRAVFLLPDKRMVTLKIGDTLSDLPVTLTQILSDKVVLQESGPRGKQTVWMSKAGAGVPGKIERIITRVEPVLLQQSQIKVIELNQPAAPDATGQKK